MTNAREQAQAALVVLAKRLEGNRLGRTMMRETHADILAMGDAAVALRALLGADEPSLIADEIDTLTLIVRDVHNYDGRPGHLSLSGAGARRIAEAALTAGFRRHPASRTDEAIEAAARVFYTSQTGCDKLSTSFYRGTWLAVTRRALEAAEEARR